MVVIKKKARTRKTTELTEPDAATDRGTRLRAFKLGSGLPSATAISEELAEMRAVLLGHKDPPIQLGPDTMMEVANGYYARAIDITSQILEGEREGRIAPKSDLYQIRTGALRMFLDMAKSSTDLGSRRLTSRKLRFEQSSRGLDAEDHDPEED